MTEKEYDLLVSVVASCVAYIRANPDPETDKTIEDKALRVMATDYLILFERALAANLIGGEMQEAYSEILAEQKGGSH